MNNSSSLLDHDRFFIFGAARSGLAAARLLVGMGKTVALYDEAPPEKIQEAQIEAGKIGLTIQNDLIEVGFPNGWEVLVLSPGIPASHPIVDLAEECGCIVRSEIELAFQACPVPLVAITGTNGKTTVTHLLTHFFNHAGRPAVMGGNVGRPLSDAILDQSIQDGGGVVVCEVSSFQLETIEHFAPEVAIVLNITPDHLDRYGAMGNYVEAKYQITENQTDRQVLVINDDDCYCLSFLPRTQASGWRFSLNHPVTRGAYLQEGTLYLASDNPLRTQAVMTLGEIPLPGLHNVANILAALSAGAVMGLEASVMAEAIKSFRAVEHRIEHIAEIQGANYYNDSKATNLDSMEKALASFDAPGGALSPAPRIILIAGGRDKGANWGDLGELVAKEVKTLILIGEATPLIRAAWSHLVAQTLEASDMKEAIERARENALPGDIVLLSPGCASFDMYPNYERRGDHFREIVLETQTQHLTVGRSI